jgi:hypothetical protein
MPALPAALPALGQFILVAHDVVVAAKPALGDARSRWCEPND